MNILIGADTYFPDINGASYFTQRLAAQLTRRGHTVHVLCPSRFSAPSHSVRQDVVIHGIPSLPLPFQSGFRCALLPQAAPYVRRLVTHIAPDIVHVQSHFPISRMLIRLACRQRLPLIATNHFMPDNLVFHLHLPPAIEAIITDWTWHDFVRVFNQVPVITTPTPLAARLIINRGITQPVEAISCGIDLERFHPQIQGDAFRQQYSIPSRPTLLYVGRLEKEKNIDLLIRALARVRQHVDAQLVIVGGGKEAGELAALARVERVADAVIFTGIVSDAQLPQAYAVSDVFCIMGTAELQSIASLEAMACGKPLIVADAVALPHLVVPGRNGYIIRPGDIQLLADRSIEVLTDVDKQRSMGHASLERSKEHALPAIVARFEQMYMATMREARLGLPATTYQYR